MASVAVTAGYDRVSGRRTLVHDLAQHKDLLLMLTWRDIKIRYKQSIMGFLWAILMPILVIGSGLIVIVAFSTMSGRPLNPADILSVAVKSVPWAFFVAAIRFATNSLVMNKELVTKIYFPREILPLASVFANGLDFIVASVVLTIILCITRIGVSAQLLWVPVILAILLTFTVGLGLLLSCANLFFRDVKYIVEIILTYGIFFTPVLYSPSKLGHWGTLLMLNPIGPMLESFTAVIVLHQPPPFAWLAYSAVWALGGSVIFWKIFRKAEISFAESI